MSSSESGIVSHSRKLNMCRAAIKGTRNTGHLDGPRRWVHFPWGSAIIWSLCANSSRKPHSGQVTNNSAMTSPGAAVYQSTPTLAVRFPRPLVNRSCGAHSICAVASRVGEQFRKQGGPDRVLGRKQRGAGPGCGTSPPATRYSGVLNTQPLRLGEGRTIWSLPRLCSSTPADALATKSSPMARELTLSVLISVALVLAAHVFLWGLTAFPPGTRTDSNPDPAGLAARP
jgi:hypothetical protein